MSQPKQNITNLPKEINYGIMLKTPLPSLIKLCETNRYYNEICYDDFFWKKKCYYDFGERADYNPENLNWKSLYMDLYDSKDVPLCIIYAGSFNDINSCDVIDKIRVHKKERFTELYKRIINIHGDGIVNLIGYDNIEYTSLLDSNFIIYDYIDKLARISLSKNFEYMTGIDTEISGHNQYKDTYIYPRTIYYVPPSNQREWYIPPNHYNQERWIAPPLYDNGDMEEVD